jgi:hypothetical protein
MADLFEKFTTNKGSLGQYQEKAHGYFAFPRLEGEISNRMIFQGKERALIKGIITLVSGTSCIPCLPCSI